MALTLAIIPPVQPCVANQAMNYVASVTNSGSTSVTLVSLQAYESTESEANISQPSILQLNASPGVGNPVLLAGSTYYYPFQVIFNSPTQSGPSPQNPGGAAPSSVAVTPDATFTLALQSQSSDGSIAATSMATGVSALIAPFPIPLGGALQMNAGANLINFLLLLA